MQTVLVLVLWFSGGAAPTTMVVEFNAPAACEDARDGLVVQLQKTGAVFVLECFPKGEIRT